MDKQFWLPFGLYGFKHSLRNVCSVPRDKQPRNGVGQLMLSVDTAGAGRGPQLLRCKDSSWGLRRLRTGAQLPGTQRVLGGQRGAGPGQMGPLCCPGRGCT